MSPRTRRQALGWLSALVACAGGVAVPPVVAAQTVLGSGVASEAVTDGAEPPAAAAGARAVAAEPPTVAPEPPTVASEPPAVASEPPVLVPDPPDASTAPPDVALEGAFPVVVRGDARLTLHRLAGSTPTEIPSVTLDAWEPVCAVPCSFVPDRSAPDVYGLARDGGPVLRAEGQPVRWLDEGTLDVAMVDRADARASGVAILVALPIAGLLVTLVPSIAHVGADGAIATTLVGSGLVVAGTALGLPLAFWGDSARVEPRD